MPPLVNGSLRLTRIRGITVYLHWSWFLLLAIELFSRGGYQSMGWNVVEYLTIFAIVTTHEFGHALACRSVGGRADTIVLWPLGGIAFVSPPRRPGAVLWSIAAGPLVNVALVPVTLALYLMLGQPAAGAPRTDLQEYFLALLLINTGLLLFNLLPVYPLDGGQIVQSILWFFLGQARSLRIVAVLGMICGALGLVAAGWLFLQTKDPLPFLVAAFVVYQAWIGFKAARHLAVLEQFEAMQANPWKNE